MASKSERTGKLNLSAIEPVGPSRVSSLGPAAKAIARLEMITSDILVINQDLTSAVSEVLITEDGKTDPIKDLNSPPKTSLDSVLQERLTDLEFRVQTLRCIVDRILI